MLTRLIAHQIKKKAHETKAVLQLRETMLSATTAVAVDLFDQLRTSFTSGNPSAGAFLTTGATVPRFQQVLTRYLKADTDAAFVKFTQDALAILRDEMVQQQASTGGYVVFAEYDADNTKFLFAALLNTKAKPNFDEKLNLISSPMLDLDHLRHGARVRFDKLADNQDGVVQFISRKAEGASDYFFNFLGCTEIVRSDVQGRNLHSALEKWAADQNLNEDQRYQLMQGTYTYWQDCRNHGRPMTLTGIANSLTPQDPAPLLTHLANETNELAGEFSAPAPSVMKTFIKFAFSKGGLKLEFDRSRWRNEIKVKGNTVTITNVPKELIEALTEEL